MIKLLKNFISIACLVVIIAAGAVSTSGARAQDRYAAPDIAYKNKDYAKAHRLWLALAEEGNASAYFNLGRMYVFGEGVQIDVIEAYKWFRLADEANLPQAKAGLRRTEPLMTPSDMKEASYRIGRWYDLHPNTRP